MTDPEECGHYDTEVVHTELHTDDTVEITKACNDCYASLVYTGLLELEDVSKPE